MITFWHGRAVSENQRLAPGKGRYRVNEEYQAFKEGIAWVCKGHRAVFEGPVGVRLFLLLNPRMDAQNIIKPVLDGLELAGVIKNDRQVRRLSIYREDRQLKEEDTIGIIVTELSKK